MNIGGNVVVEDKEYFRVARSTNRNTTVSENMHSTKALGGQSNDSNVEDGCSKLSWG